MALKITPGQNLPKDGQAFADIENELKGFVNQTEILNLGIENFTGNSTPFVVSASEPPSFRTPGQMWFNRTDGRMYVWYDRGVSAASEAQAGFSRNDISPEHWICVSDRKQIYAIMLQRETYHLTAGNQPVRMEAGSIEEQSLYSTLYDGDTVVEWTLSDAIAAAAVAPLGIQGANKAWAGVRLGTWGGRIHTNKLFVSTTDYTLAGINISGGVFHDLGYHRVLCSAVVGPNYAGVEGNIVGSDGGGGASNPAQIALGEIDAKGVHRPSGNPYEWDYGNRSAFVGYITESGSHSTRDKVLTFWHGSSPTSNWIEVGT